MSNASSNIVHSWILVRLLVAIFHWPNSIFTWMKTIVCLLCLWCRDLPNQGTSCCSFGTIAKPSMSRGAPSLFHNVSTYGGEVIEFWIIFSLKFHFNQNRKLQGNLPTLLVLLESLVGIVRYPTFMKTYFHYTHNKL